MVRISSTAAWRFAFAGFVAVAVSGCTSASVSQSDLNKQTFALAPAQPLVTLPATPAKPAPSSSARKADQSAEARKRQLAEAKRKLEMERKRLAAFDAMTKGLSEQQKALMSAQRNMLSGQADKTAGEVDKLEASLRPKVAGVGGSKYHALIARYASENGVPLKLAHAVVRVESAYRANARGRAGEIGLMQIKLSTARGLGYRGSAKGLYDPATNLKYGMKYLGRAHQLAGGSTCGTILKYNAGHGAKSMNPISSRYCSKVKRYI